MSDNLSRPGWVPNGRAWKLTDGPFQAIVAPWGERVSLDLSESSLDPSGTLADRQQRCEETIASMRRQVAAPVSASVLNEVTAALEDALIQFGVDCREGPMVPLAAYLAAHITQAFTQAPDLAVAVRMLEGETDGS